MTVDAGNRDHIDLAGLPPLLKPRTAAAILDCCDRTVTRMLERGVIRGCRAGNSWRVNRDSLLRYAGLSDDGPRG